MTPPPYVVPVACAQACLNATVGICPRALVVILLGLAPGERGLRKPQAAILAQLWEASWVACMAGLWARVRGQGERCVRGGESSVACMTGRRAPSFYIDRC
jgi:hypothetical protein